MLEHCECDGDLLTLQLLPYPLERPLQIGPEVNLLKGGPSGRLTGKYRHLIWLLIGCFGLVCGREEEKKRASRVIA